jgi:hypothetical protein
MNISYDIDGVLANFLNAFLETGRELGLGDELPDHWVLFDEWEIASPEVGAEIWSRIEGDNKWWMNIPPHEDAHIVTPVHCYITSRSIPSKVSRAWLQYHGFPPAPVHTVDVGNSKLKTTLEEGVDLHIDDKPATVRELNENGVDCLLRDRPVNRSDKDLDPVRLHCLTQVSNFLPQ